MRAAVDFDELAIKTVSFVYFNTRKEESGGLRVVGELFRQSRDFIIGPHPGRTRWLDVGRNRVSWVVGLLLGHNTLSRLHLTVPSLRLWKD